MKPPADISLAVRSVDSLLDTAGSPLLGPRIHPAAAHELRYHAGNAPRTAALRVTVTVPASDLARQPEVEAAIHAHFRESESELTQKLREVGPQGRWSFVVALLAVTVVLLASEAIAAFGQTRLSAALSQGTVIIAWVIMWRPTETLLYERFPLWRERALARRLATAPVTLHPAAAAGPH